MYRIAAPAPVGPASGPLLEVRPRSGSGLNYGRIWASHFGAIPTAAEGTSDEGTSINIELDQYLSEPLVNRQDDPASCMVEDEHAQVSSLVTTG